MSLIGVLLAVLIGLSLGLLGGGGSILTVPIFVYILGYDAKAAIGMSLAVVGVTSLVGAASHWRAGNLRPRTALLFGGVAMVGSVLGTRLVGVGGGFLIVPALVLLAGVPMKPAVGTSLLVIAMNAAAGFAGYLGQTVIDWGVVLTFTAVAVAGILVGARLARFVSPQALRRSFGVFLVAMGLFILFQNRAAFLLG